MADAISSLVRLMAGGALSRSETEELFGRLMDGELSEAQTAALLVALAMKGESAEEITGAALAMRRRMVVIESTRRRVVDTCGTGGDGKGTFNISTAAALVAAAGGAAVAKHGNRSVSSRSGSADVLAALGVRLEIEPERASRALDEIGIAFLFAPRLHPAMKEASSVRQQLAVRTIFNLLGPLTNPAGARRQLLGVFSADRVEPMARVLLELGSEHALVVHGSDGLDEITTTGASQVAEVRSGEVVTYTVEPEEYGFRRVSVGALAGADPATNARRMRQVLAGEPGPLAEVTALNAGAALYVAGEARDLAAAVELSREVLASGAGARKLEQLRSFSAS